MLDNVQSSAGVMINGDDNVLTGGTYSNIQVLSAADRTRLRDLKYGGTCSDYPSNPGSDGVPYTNCGAVVDASGTMSTEWAGLSYYWTGHPGLPDAYAKPSLGDKLTRVTFNELQTKLSGAQPAGVVFYCSDCGSTASGGCSYTTVKPGRMALRNVGVWPDQWRCF